MFENTRMDSHVAFIHSMKYHLSESIPVHFRISLCNTAKSDILLAKLVFLLNRYGLTHKICSFFTSTWIETVCQNKPVYLRANCVHFFFQNLLIIAHQVTILNLNDWNSELMTIVAQVKWFIRIFPLRVTAGNFSQNMCCY